MRILKGLVVSTKQQKTATVSVSRVVVHPVYKKRYKRTKKYQVHDEVGTSVGDNVSFVPSRPYSKLKRWKITEILTDKKGKSGGKK